MERVEMEGQKSVRMPTILLSYYKFGAFYFKSKFSEINQVVMTQNLLAVVSIQRPVTNYLPLFFVIFAINDNP
jgi:hypothetical protein